MIKINNLSNKNQTTEFLLYTTPNGKVKVEIFLRDENIWLTQKKIAKLFDVDRSVITKHLKNIFKSPELEENSVCAKIAQVQSEIMNKFGISEFRQKFKELNFLKKRFQKNPKNCYDKL